MQVHHLSHIDLDGYSAQLVAKECFSDIKFYNANYGKEIEARIQNILNNIKNSPKNDFLILITDLNLNLNEAKFLQDEVNLLNSANKNIKLKLLDHHITGKDSANAYEWYYLDSSICATKITFEVLSKEFSFRDSLMWLGPFCEMVNSADTWQENSFGFNFGKVALGMIAQSREFSRFMFDDYDREFKFNMLYKAKDYLLDENNNLIPNSAVNLDNNIFLFKKTLLDGDINAQTMDEILSIKQSNILSENKNNYTIFYNGKKGLLTYMIGGISVLANLFLKQNDDFDFFMDLSNKGNVSLRANGKFDVSQLAKTCFSGGGHKNASGGKFEGFRETFLYENAKEQVNNLLNLH